MAAGILVFRLRSVIISAFGDIDGNYYKTYIRINSHLNVDASPMKIRSLHNNLNLWVMIHVCLRDIPSDYSGF